MAQVQQLQKKLERQETYDRLTAPFHVVQSRFTEHKAIEGYFEDRKVPDFFGCDRLLKLDTRFGTIQMGYDPKKGQSFLFANIKTSIYDTAASAYQRQMNDMQRMKEQKTGNQNIAYSSRRRQNSATILYKYENKPWSAQSVQPYLNRANMGALRKTMPFLNSRDEQDQRRQFAVERRRNMDMVQEYSQRGDADVVRQIRARQVDLERRSEMISAILYRKDTQSRLFFRKVNMVFDLQKQKMFDYYRKERARRRREAENVAAQGSGNGENDNNNNNDEGR